jgi:hypothetical protein
MGCEALHQNKNYNSFFKRTIIIEIKVFMRGAIFSLLFQLVFSSVKPNLLEAQYN